MLGLAPEVIEALAHYRRLLGDRGWDWGGEEPPEFFRWARFSLLGPVFEAVAQSGDWGGAVRSVIGDEIPAGVVVVHVDADRRLSVRTGPARPAIAGKAVKIDVVVDSDAVEAVELTVAGRSVPVPAAGTAIEPIDVDGATPVFTVELDGRAVPVDGALSARAASELRLVSSAPARWSVTDATGGAWFPDGVPRKWDVHHRPFFHGREVALAVPSEPLTVVCARGLEYERVETEVRPAAAETLPVTMNPAHLFDPTVEGWYGGVLHIHLNYSGDLVCAPADAARMQDGEALHLANLVAANGSTSRVYERELLEHHADTDLPGFGPGAIARVGVEYRNDLLGHVHGFGLTRPPRRFYSGHERSDNPNDWPPNAAACEELRGLGATVGYAHPSFTDFPDWSYDRFFENPRTAEARELVADAALGVVDSIDLISPYNDDGAVFLYHRLLSCGLRLAATAGTDVFLSFSHGPGVASNPPGWGRVYARLGEEPLSANAFRSAIRAGRTVVTNGPWLTLEVNGHGPGSVLDLGENDGWEARARVRGPGVEELALVGPDGVLARGGGDEIGYAT
ncbi:MAG TPA: CehA/McbA family metallohydrolase, partial [Stackebrandtia sp.]|uniref:CehA/McbA family metallohydrolase n=1 Tax=Stackebrandtia sp. TaxID=2023065 RepID=UPI002D356319